MTCPKCGAETGKNYIDFCPACKDEIKKLKEKQHDFFREEEKDEF